ncbi:helix-turn-helix transcriptional regulator [Caldibacillus debilis]|uniref:helix-turn-helix transcriptional regulator n=1 Tax=Caldibacillus debilis TaxID=301148 RepID=UPI000E36ED2C|nr:helix-turn-helix transcriptional regulator [Caldibacillus debilis]REJ29256.1 MAG: transcriptional regulator [Caldibacillus debilis]
MRMWLKQKREELGLTQEQVAASAKIARTTYAMIEQNQRDPSVNVAKRIAKTLNFEWTLFFEDQLHETHSKSTA